MKADYDALRSDVGAVWLSRDVIQATGEDVVSFLQGQLSQDVDKIEVGGSAWSWILQPHGKVDALVRLVRTDETTFLIDTDRRFGEVVVERLQRFKMRTKVEFTALDCKVLALRGPHALALRDAASVTPDVVASHFVVPVNWKGMTGFDILGQDPIVPNGVQVCDVEAYEALRIEHGVPQMGAELDEKTIPAEVDLNDWTISFNKGCYTGQELVARIDARGGNVPRHLRGLIIDTADAPLPGAKVITKGTVTAVVKPFGYITSTAFSPRLGKTVALAFIRRDVIVPCAARVVADEGTFDALITTLPITE